MRWPPWAYGAVGAGYALAAGFSAIYAAPFLMGPPELEHVETRDSHAAAREERKPDMGRLAAVASAVAQNPCLQGSATIAARPAAAAAPSAHAPAEASATSSDSEAGAERDLTYDEVVFKLNILSKSALLATLVCGGAVLFNSRVLFGWQRGRRADYDADAFQRAFSKFMNDKGWEREHPGSRSQRSQNFKHEHDEFWREFHKRDEQTRRRQEQFRREQEEFRRKHGFGRGERRREYDGRWGYNAGGEQGGFRNGFPLRSTGEIQAALKQLAIDMPASQVASGGMSAKSLKSAYLQAAKKAHPDGKADKDKAHFEQEFKRVSAAFTLLQPMCK